MMMLFGKMVGETKYLPYPSITRNSSSHIYISLVTQTFTEREVPMSMLELRNTARRYATLTDMRWPTFPNAR